MNRIAWIIAGLTTFAAPALAAEDDIHWVTTSRARFEIAIGGHGWPGIADLQPLRAGSFDEIGYNLSMAGHWPVKRFRQSELLVGADLGFFSNESDIRFVTDSLIARGLYLTPSLKWMFGDEHRYSLDAGAGYYLLDITEVAGSYPIITEFQLWEQGAFGGYVGATVDFGGGRPGRNRGVMLAFKTHFADFGTVRDVGPGVPPTLGADAGELSGPVYVMQIGYRWR